MNDKSSGQQRPKVLLNATETQIEELERQFEEQDKQGWRALTNSYGWPEKESQAVWDWFGASPRPGGDSSAQASTGGR